VVVVVVVASAEQKKNKRFLNGIALHKKIKIIWF